MLRIFKAEGNTRVRINKKMGARELGEFRGVRGEVWLKRGKYCLGVQEKRTVGSVGI